MAALIAEGFRAYKVWVIGKMDPRSDDWLLMSSPWNAVAIAAAYLYFVMVLGPRLMKNRPPLQLDGIMKVYNLVQVLCCSYLVERSLTLGWATNYRWICETVDFSNTPHHISITRCVWLFMMIKLLDLMDTVFIVLRKKDTQVTFLHVYHHTGIFITAWCCTKYYPGGHCTLVGPVNSFVHVVMYAYYFVTTTWPEYKKNIWWKKHITQLQMMQFLFLGLHATLPLVMGDACAYPKPIAGFCSTQNLIMFLLFADFYRKAYRKKAV